MYNTMHGVCKCQLSLTDMRQTAEICWHIMWRLRALQSRLTKNQCQSASKNTSSLLGRCTFRRRDGDVVTLDTRLSRSAAAATAATLMTSLVHESISADFITTDSSSATTAALPKSLSLHSSAVTSSLLTDHVTPCQRHLDNDTGRLRHHNVIQPSADHTVRAVRRIILSDLVLSAWAAV